MNIVLDDGENFPFNFFNTFIAKNTIRNECISVSFSTTKNHV